MPLSSRPADGGSAAKVTGPLRPDRGVRRVLLQLDPLDEEPDDPGLLGGSCLAPGACYKSLTIQGAGAEAWMPFVEPTEDDQKYMRLALEEAQRGYGEGGVPVGSVLVEDGRLVARGHNRRVQEGDPIAHGEMDCLRRAGRRPHYQGTVLYTTLSPCMMCTGAILQFGIPRVVVAERSNFEGHCDFLAERGVDVVLLDDPDCIELMARFIRERPELWNEDIAEEG